MTFAEQNPMIRTCEHCGAKLYSADRKYHLLVAASNRRAAGESLFSIASSLGVTKEFLRELGVR